MKPFSTTWAAAMIAGCAVLPAAARTVVGVSWSNFQEVHWKTDEKAI